MRAYRWLVALVFMAGGLHAQTVGSLASSACPLGGCAQGGTGTVTTTSTLVSGRVALSSGASSLTDDAGCTWTGTGASFIASFWGGVRAPLLSGGANSTGTNTAATTTTVAGQLGTGTGASGDVVFTVGTPQASGSTQHVAATALTLHNAGSVGAANTQVLIASGTPSLPALAFAAFPNYGIFLSGGTSLVHAGTEVVTTDPSGVMLSNAGAQHAHVSVPGNAIIQLGLDDAASPVAQTLQAQGSRGGTDTNVAGANLTIRPGAGTGSATGSSIIFQTPTATTSGTGAQTQTTRITVNETHTQFEGRIYGLSDILLYKRNGVALGDLATASTGGYNTIAPGYGDMADGAVGARAYLFMNSAGSSVFGSMTGPAGVTALTESSATGFATLTYGASEAVSAEFLVRIKANDATDFQSLTSRVRVSSIRKATGNTISTVNVVGTDLLAESAGASTLACTFTVTEGAGAVTLLANCASSLTQTTLNASYVAETVGAVRVDQL